jgi:precorrin-4/cobalt-precorrin-4 C11-methyltransferase
MNALDALGIPWDMTPGVSSFSAAAASLGAEYTLPGVSQSLILTRLSGRTPSTESLRALAAHGCSMVIFLSAGLVDRVQEELLAGGYRETTPTAVVYKASWPEERILRCPLGQLAERTREAGITRTALIAVGDFLNGAGERSCLYHPDFTTGYRKGDRT